MKQIQMIPGTVDTHIHQRLDLPTVSLTHGSHAAADSWD